MGSQVPLSGAASLEVQGLAQGRTVEPSLPGGFPVAGDKAATTKQIHDDAFWKPTRSLQSVDNLARFSNRGVDEAQGEIRR